MGKQLNRQVIAAREMNTFGRLADRRKSRSDPKSPLNWISLAALVGLFFPPFVCWPPSMKGILPFFSWKISTDCG